MKHFGMSGGKYFNVCYIISYIFFFLGFSYLYLLNNLYSESFVGSFGGFVVTYYFAPFFIIATFSIFAAAMLSILIAFIGVLFEILVIESISNYFINYLKSKGFIIKKRVRK